MNKLDCTIASIVSGFVRTEFLISNIAYKLGIKESQLHIFAESNTARKISNLKKILKKSDIDKKKKYIELLEKYNTLRIERNRMVHSMILTNIKNQDELHAYDYKLDKEKIVRDIAVYRYSDLEDLIDKIIALHNDFFELFYDKSSG